MIFVIFLGGYVSISLNRLYHLTLKIDAVDGATLRSIDHFNELLFSQVGFEKKFLISMDQDFYSQYRAISAYILKDLETMGSLVDTAEKKELLAASQELYGRYLDNYREEVGKLVNLQGYTHKEYLVQRDNILNQINYNLQSMRNAIRRDQGRKILASSQISSQVFNFTTIAAGIIVLIGITISLFNTQSINRSIRLLQEKTKEIAGGKFEEITPIASPPEINDLANHFNMMCRRLKELDDMKIDFISHVSHELRTPLTAIREASSMLLEGTYRDSPEKQQELLTITKNECERLIDSVNRILDLSRMEANMMDYRYQKCRLIPVIKKAVLKLAPIAQRNNIGVELELPVELPTVMIDEERIGQVLENLIGNALKFSSPDSVVKIYATLKKSASRFIEISISDTGDGIPEKSLENIFDKFQRIQDGKVTVRGTGLGLSIAKHIIVAHGGIIWAESKVGKGSAFFFTLPV